MKITRRKWIFGTLVSAVGACFGIAKAEKKQDAVYDRIISGFDWGGSDYTGKFTVSHAAHVIVGVRSDGVLELIDWHFYAGLDYKILVNMMVRNHLKNGGTEFVASDLVFVRLLAIHPLLEGQRRIYVNYGPSSWLPMVRRNKFNPDCVNLNRDLSLELLLSAARHGVIKGVTPSHSDLIEKVLERSLPNREAGITHGLNYAFTLATMRDKPVEHV